MSEYDGKATKDSGKAVLPWRIRTNRSGQTVPVIEDVMVEILHSLRRIESSLERIQRSIDAERGL